MLERFEDQERLSEKTEQHNDDLHRNLTPGDRSIEVEPAEKASATTKDAADMSTQRGNDMKWQGDIGEGTAIQVGSEKLGMTPDPRFDQPYHGMDGVCRDGNGKLVVMEAKLAKGGITALHKDQMQPEWVERKANLMQQEGSQQYTPGNAEIGAEIEKVGPENVRRVVVVTDPSSLEVTAFEGQGDRSWREIGNWSAFEFEQPHFKA